MSPMIRSSWPRFPMSEIRIKTAFAGLAAALVMGVGAARVRPSSVDVVRPTEDEVRDQDIAFFQARIERDPEGALDRSMLGGLYLQRARTTGSVEDLLRAEEVARESFGLRSRKNGMALHILATALVGQHRYREALEEVAILVEDDSSNLSYRALKGEIEMELGLYAAADRTFGSLRSWSYHLTVAPRLARWEEITGHPGNARALLERARDEALTQVNLPLEQKAWFHLRVGDLALRYGRMSEAERAWKAGLQLSPADHRLLAGMSRLEASRRRWKPAIQYGEAAIAQSLDPATLGILSDAYAAMNQPAKAAEYARAMEMVVLAQPGALHRAWSLFLLNHDRQVESVLANVEAEMVDRKDIYGYDLLAWALHKNGRSCEARVAMRQALAWGTIEPMLLSHAREIESTPCPNS
jgi:tetratricopeptide (TPR) repeat protein